MQLTTREAVEDALYHMADFIAESKTFGKDQCHTRNSMKLLCEHYGFKLDQFFDSEVAE